MSLRSARARKHTRFSLLLLDDDEVLLTDLAVQYQLQPRHPAGSQLHPLHGHPQRLVHRSAHTSLRGRVKIATHSLFFDSDDWRDPVVRIPLQSITHARPTRDSSRSHGSDGSSPAPSVISAAPLPTPVPDDHDLHDNSVLVAATAVVFQRELASDHPYIDVHLPASHIFTPLYTPANDLLDEINTLLRIIASPSTRVRDAGLRDLVQQREVHVAFDITALQHGVHEAALMDAAASAILPMSRDPGRFRVTRENLYFMPIHAESARGVERIPVASILSLRRMRHGCRDAALEVVFAPLPDPVSSCTGSSSPVLSPSPPLPVMLTGAAPRDALMLSFPSHHVRERAYAILLDIAPVNIELFGRRELETTLTRWRAGTLSNFDYLMYLNLAAGRSFNDLSQYPVFPWVLADYTSVSLDLRQASSFRNLTKPVGALDSQRLEIFERRYHDMPSPRFYYGTHYSAPAYVINYLVRAAPGAMLRLQNGRFDTPDRLFHSVASTWSGVQHNQSDVKELIPEFFALDFSTGAASGVVPPQSSPGEFLDNVLGLDLGVRQDGKRVDGVELPPWANGSSELFVRLNREALESDYVSMHLHNWIDLIFGVKSRSAEAQNIFYTDAALPQSIDPADEQKITLEEMKQIETVYLEFGRTPERLFGHPHPPRFGDDRLDVEEDAGVNTICESEMKLKTNTDTGKSPSSALGVAVAQFGDGDDFRHSNLLAPASLDPISEIGNTSTRSLSSLSNIWGSRSRRIDSVLTGARDHALSTFEPRGVEENAKHTQTISTSSMTQILACNPRHEVLDFCIIDDGPDFTSQPSDNGHIANHAVTCTVSSDGYLRVHSMTGTLRAKHIGSPSTVTYLGGGIVAFGTRAGALGLYHIASAREPSLHPGAHDVGVSAVAGLHHPRVLASASVDASVRVWLVASTCEARLRAVADLDAEAGVEDVCLTVTDATTALVAAVTGDGVLAWRVDVGADEMDNEDFAPPLWRCDVGPTVTRHGSGRMRGAAWLNQGSRRRPAVAGVVGGSQCVRVWALDGDGMAAAEVFVGDGGALCVTGCDESRSVLVGGGAGRVSEFDSTGLCLGSVEVRHEGEGVQNTDAEVRQVVVASDGQCFYVLFGSGEVVRVDR